MHLKGFNNEKGQRQYMNMKHVRPNIFFVMLPSATDRKNVKTHYLKKKINALNIKKLTVFEGKCKNTNK